MIPKKNATENFAVNTDLSVMEKCKGNVYRNFREELIYFCGDLSKLLTLESKSWPR